MLLSDKFVFIHFPKTGGTFVTKTIEKIHPKNRLGRLDQDRKLTKLLMLLGIAGGSVINLKDGHYAKHATYDDIPFRFKNKKIFSTIRNPYDQYVSQYEFGFWKKFPERFFFDVENFLKLYPGWEEISFPEYIRLVNIRKHVKRLEENSDNPEFPVGRQTYEFMNFFFKQSAKIFASEIDEKYVKNGDYKRDLAPVHFLTTEYLNRELYNFLITLDYEPKDLKFILESEKIFPKEGGRSEDKKWSKYYDSELKQYVRRR